MKMTHEQARAEAFARDVGHQKKQFAAGFEHIAAVPANEFRWLAVVMAVPHFKGIVALRKTGALHIRREPKIVLQPCSLSQKQIVQVKVWRSRK
jgi:hypothetical protein